MLSDGDRGYLSCTNAIGAGRNNTSFGLHSVGRCLGDLCGLNGNLGTERAEVTHKLPPSRGTGYVVQWGTLWEGRMIVVVKPAGWSDAPWSGARAP